jgi:SpoVK/Ycf46/Vps4 family AAA+-type ATPase
LNPLAERTCFSQVHGPDLFSPYVGQSEARLRALFAAAREP